MTAATSFQDMKNQFAFASLTVAVAAGACTDPLSLAGRGCPCAAGYSCCEASNVCVENASACGPTASADAQAPVAEAAGPAVAGRRVGGIGLTVHGVTEDGYAVYSDASGVTRALSIANPALPPTDITADPIRLPSVDGPWIVGYTKADPSATYATLVVWSKATGALAAPGEFGRQGGEHRVDLENRTLFAVRRTTPYTAAFVAFDLPASPAAGPLAARELWGSVQPT